MAKSLEQINQEFLSAYEAREPKYPPSDKPKHPIARVFDVLFYVVITLILAAALIFSGRANGWKTFRYSLFTVLSDSMQRAIPQGSLIIVKSVDAEEIKVGDDITFKRSDNETVTHRVVNILENYDESGRGFQTKGVENAAPDDEITSAGNVIGVVKTSVPELGFTLSYLQDNTGTVLLILGGLAVATIAGSRVLAGTGRKKR